MFFHIFLRWFRYCIKCKRNWDKREEVKAYPLGEWYSHWGCNENWLETIRPKTVEDSTSCRPWASLYTHYNTLTYAKSTPTGTTTVSRLTIKARKCTMAQFLEISTPSPEIVGITLPLVSLWNYSAMKTNHSHISGPSSPSEIAYNSVCGGCSSKVCLRTALTLSSWNRHTLEIFRSRIGSTRCNVIH